MEVQVQYKEPLVEVGKVKCGEIVRWEGKHYIVLFCDDNLEKMLEGRIPVANLETGQLFLGFMQTKVAVVKGKLTIDKE